MDRIIKHDSLSNRLCLLWIGLGLYILAYAQTDLIAMGIIGNVFYHLIPFGTLLILFSLISTLHPSLIDRTKTAWGLIVALLVWHVYMAFRTDPEDLLGLMIYSDPYAYTAYLFALVLLIPPIPLVKSYYVIAHWLIIIGIPLTMLPLFLYASFGAIQFCFEGFIAAAGLVVMTNKFQNRTWLRIAYFALILAFLVATIKARRGLMATTLLYLIGGAYMTVFKGNKIKRNTQLFIVASGISLLLISAAVFMMNSKGVFSEITRRADENTRDYVFLLFFWDMIKTPLDIVFGRGIRGGYECPGVDEGGVSIRYAIENGLLHMMLKGGLVYIILVLSIMILAIKNAWHSTNQLCQASIIIIAIQLFDMLPFGVLATNVKAYIIWMCISICLCPSICKKTNEELILDLTEKKLKLPKWE